MHDRIDEAIGSLSMADGADYARFLLIQYTARQPIETWLIEALEPANVPPPQTPLIADDLAQLDIPLPPSKRAQNASGFMPPHEGDPLGALWVLAGSSMGNRAIMARREKAGLDGPTRFLSGTSMPSYFGELRDRLEQACAHEQAEPVIAMANAVFANFLDAVQLEARLEPNAKHTQAAEGLQWISKAAA